MREEEKNERRREGIEKKRKSRGEGKNERRREG